ncbi:hypothetical protein DUNSADRAFT_13687 [Dunaliella salina]|uniref:PIH1D1/2/3 CS-like domain-containing protein n=1 Tax=Dunaliella salina TaxID=3046 RepID=A0ABQ7G8W6_DUNSA|nr:hypothetical protein DUNSADRAFT_13687 [Dunaliella salina]|eukprot:KAF5831036.1 hypothetical protein DUNSADRAFT_13687 [Dunaliella salina]
MDQLFNLMRSSSGEGSMPGLESMLGPEFAGQDLSKQADQLWRFLDNLAEDDPQAYADFLKSQAKAAEAEQSQQVVRGSSAQVLIEAQLAQPVHTPAVLHIWAARDGSLVPMATVGHGAAEVNANTTLWAGARIPMFEGQAPQDPPPPPSHSISQPKANPCPSLQRQFHIGVHPKLMPMLALDQPPQLRPVLIEAALQFVESRYAVKMDRSRPCVFKMHRSQLHLASRAAAAAASQMGGKAATSTPHDLMCAMANMQQPSSDGDASGSSSHTPASAECKQDDKELAKQLIQEVHSQPVQQVGNKVEDGNRNRVLGVQHSLSKEGQRCLVIEAALPGASCVQDVSVEFAQEQQAIILGVQGWVQTVQLPCSVNESMCKAKFDKRKQVLKVTVPCF